MSDEKQDEQPNEDLIKVCVGGPLAGQRKHVDSHLDDYVYNHPYNVFLYKDQGLIFMATKEELIKHYHPDYDAVSMACELNKQSHDEMKARFEERSRLWSEDHEAQRVTICELKEQIDKINDEHTKQLLIKDREITRLQQVEQQMRQDMRDWQKQYGQSDHSHDESLDLQISQELKAKNDLIETLRAEIRDLTIKLQDADKEATLSNYDVGMIQSDYEVLDQRIEHQTKTIQEYIKQNDLLAGKVDFLERRLQRMVLEKTELRDRLTHAESPENIDREYNKLNSKFHNAVKSARKHKEQLDYYKKLCDDVLDQRDTLQAEWNGARKFIGELIGHVEF